MDKRTTLLLLAALGVALATGSPALGFDWESFNGEDYEEPVGGSAWIELNPADTIYGLSIGSGVWLLNTPVFGDYFIGMLYNGLEEGLYGEAGMTVRLMPHWRWAPFAGGGGSYDAIISRSSDSETGAANEPQKGNSYWAGHAEAGLRISVGGSFYELLGRYTWTSSDIPEPDYWLIRIGYGQRF